eukprot:TRINITY_DN16213_c0_g2_i1.p1 TRINITY_DN16213_c0_g2~~TRINITY_DN16213_c0_g2_i1.p1  ORF type:complete len:486 (+),score=135.38 TRINITY_DN16213_c0_g2_i1:90-1547(+)
MQDRDFAGPATALGMLALWWKRQQLAHPEVAASLPEDMPPEAILREVVARRSDAREYLTRQAALLRRAALEGRGHLELLLSSVMELLGDTKAALTWAAAACTAAKENVDKYALRSDHKRLAEAVEDLREAKVEAARLRLWAESDVARLGRVPPQAPGSGLPQARPPLPIARRNAADLSPAEFMERYAGARVPVIITGVVDRMRSGAPWTLDWLCSQLGKKRVQLKREARGSPEWARLENAGSAAFSDFAQAVRGARAGSLAGCYLHDQSIPERLPELLPHFTVPAYFCGDWLLRTPTGSLYRNSWPSLFVGGTQARSPLHIDAFGSHFWMGLMEGSKRWVLYRPEDAPMLSPQYPKLFDAVFRYDPFAAEEEQEAEVLAAARQIEATEFVLNAGELLFVPCGTPHAVQNITPTVAVSGNFVNHTNQQQALEELKVCALHCPRAAELRHALQEPPPEAPRKLSHTPLQRLKAKFGGGGGQPGGGAA